MLHLYILVTFFHRHLHSYIGMSQFYRDVAFLNVEITHCQIVMPYDLHTDDTILHKDETFLHKDKTFLHKDLTFLHKDDTCKLNIFCTSTKAESRAKI